MRKSLVLSFVLIGVGTLLIGSNTIQAQTPNWICFGNESPPLCANTKEDCSRLNLKPGSLETCYAHFGDSDACGKISDLSNRTSCYESYTEKFCDGFFVYLGNNICANNKDECANLGAANGHFCSSYFTCRETSDRFTCLKEIHEYRPNTCSPDPSSSFCISDIAKMMGNSDVCKFVKTRQERNWCIYSSGIEYYTPSKKIEAILIPSLIAFFLFYIIIGVFSVIRKRPLLLKNGTLLGIVLGIIIVVTLINIRDNFPADSFVLASIYEQNDVINGFMCRYGPECSSGGWISFPTFWGFFVIFGLIPLFYGFLGFLAALLWKTTVSYFGILNSSRTNTSPN